MFRKYLISLVSVCFIFPATFISYVAADSHIQLEENAYYEVAPDTVLPINLEDPPLTDSNMITPRVFVGDGLFSMSVVTLRPKNSLNTGGSSKWVEKRRLSGRVGYYVKAPKNVSASVGLCTWNSKTGLAKSAGSATFVSGANGLNSALTFTLGGSVWRDASSTTKFYGFITNTHASNNLTSTNISFVNLR